MCGIFGFYTFNSGTDLSTVLRVIFKGLKRLEYRGYDSAGIAVDISNNVFTIVKEVGKVSFLESKTFNLAYSVPYDLSSTLLHQSGIAHTRWATHGIPSVVNCHPHVSDTDLKFVVVHNGIISNYKKLKDFLIGNGVEFESETDTEVIPKLCLYIHSTVSCPISFPKLVSEVASMIEGAYAFIIKSTLYPGELVAAKKGSPLLFGMDFHADDNTLLERSFGAAADSDDDKWLHGHLKCYIASDASAIVEHTRNAIVLEDNDILHLRGCGYGIFNPVFHNSVHVPVQRELFKLHIQASNIEKGEFEHFMLKEIFEQPESLKLTLNGRVCFDHVSDVLSCPQIKLGGFVNTIETIKSSRRIIFIACGTSHHACLASRQTMEELCDIPVVVELASDFLDRNCKVYRNDTCVFVSQSGETADTLMALRHSKEMGALCVGITNTVGSSISRLTDCGVYLHVGPEIGVASTKAYTASILAITMMALNLSEDSRAKHSMRSNIANELHNLPNLIRSSLLLEPIISKLAQQLKDESSLIFFARGRNYATALESALKIKEIALIHSEGILAGEMKHGPLALVDEHLPILVFATMDDMHSKMDSVIQQLLSRGANLVIMCSENDPSMNIYEERGCLLIRVPHTVDSLQPIVNVVPMQLLSYHLTVLKGCNVDQPRNLAKSVTTYE
jgi:glucosamine--fructose-6-phosphate aminotransferase (isomerizing)